MLCRLDHLRAQASYLRVRLTFAALPSKKSFSSRCAVQRDLFEVIDPTAMNVQKRGSRKFRVGVVLNMRPFQAGAYKRQSAAAARDDEGGGGRGDGRGSKATQKKTGTESCVTHSNADLL